MQSEIDFYPFRIANNLPLGRLFPCQLLWFLPVFPQFLLSLLPPLFPLQRFPPFPRRFLLPTHFYPEPRLVEESPEFPLFQFFALQLFPPWFQELLRHSMLVGLISLIYRLLFSFQNLGETVFLTFLRLVALSPEKSAEMQDLTSLEILAVPKKY